MKLGIMQPYFLPYIGYFQLMNAVDEFVVYDNIEFSKKGWINRNRILVNGRDAWITLPLKKDSDYLDVRERYLADTWPEQRMKLLNRIRESYRKATQFECVFPVLEKSILYENLNLFCFIYHALLLIKEYLDIETAFIVSSDILVDYDLKSEDKVLAICKARHADMYVNPVGGMDLYSKEKFKANGIDLHFLKANDFQYPQFNNVFVPWLSIIDVMMFNSKEKIKKYLSSFYTLL